MVEQRTLPGQAGMPALFWRSVMGWLQRPPIADPQDRRNSAVLQVVLLVAGVATPAMTLLSPPEGLPDTTSAWVGLAATVLIWFNFALLRQGRFRLPASLTVAGSLALIALSYRNYGLAAQSGLQVTHLVPLLFAGLLLGRQAVWRTLVLMVAILALGAWVDLRHGTGGHATAGDVSSNLMLSALGFLMVAVILDRLIDASQSAIRRSHALDLLCDQLEQEIEEKERSHAQLLHAQKIEAVGRLASGIAHDFNNVLGVIAGYATRADARRDLAVAGDCLEGIAGAAQRGALLTRRLLTLSRSNVRQVAVFDAAASLRAMLPLLTRMFGDGVRIETGISGPLPICMDRDEFELALLNIAGNARDAMHAGGVFRVQAEEDADGRIEICLDDTGCGMPPEVAERIFEPFYTTKPAGRGTGIGLAVVHRLITEAGGGIEVESAPGQGTRLRLVLPSAAPMPSSGAGDLTGIAASA